MRYEGTNEGTNEGNIYEFLYTYECEGTYHTRITIAYHPFTKRRISQNVSTSDHTRSVLKIRLNGYPFSVIDTR